MSKKILLIVEGLSDEIRFFRRLFECCYKKLEYNFYSYKTSLHVLAQELYNNYPDFESDNIDIRLVLSSLESNESRKKILRDQYSDVFLIFDFEPQDHNTHYDTIKRMLSYFTDSTGQGKLFINYPMMQSYKHFSKLPDYDFDQKFVSIEQVKEYKSLVAKESKYTDLGQYNYVTFYSIAYHHLKKAEFIQNDMISCPSLESFNELNYQTIFDKQVLLRTKNKVWILNTCILAFVEFSPIKFFTFIQKHKSELFL